MHEPVLVVPESRRDDEAIEGRVARARKAKTDAAKRVRQRHAKVKPGNFKIRIGDVTVIRKGYRYASR